MNMQAQLKAKIKQFRANFKIENGALLKAKLK
jgi:hypothetical protein